MAVSRVGNSHTFQVTMPSDREIALRRLAVRRERAQGPLPRLLRHVSRDRAARAPGLHRNLRAVRRWRALGRYHHPH